MNEREREIKHDQKRETRIERRKEKRKIKNAGKDIENKSKITKTIILSSFHGVLRKVFDCRISFDFIPRRNKRRVKENPMNSLESQERRKYKIRERGQIYRKRPHSSKKRKEQKQHCL